MKIKELTILITHPISGELSRSNTSIEQIEALIIYQTCIYMVVTVGSNVLKNVIQ